MALRGNLCSLFWFQSFPPLLFFALVRPRDGDYLVVPVEQPYHMTTQQVACWREKDRRFNKVKKTNKERQKRVSLCLFGSTFFYVASRADGMDVPQGLHKGSIHLDVAIGDR